MSASLEGRHSFEDNRSCHDLVRDMLSQDPAIQGSWSCLHGACCSAEAAERNAQPNPALPDSDG